MENPEASISSDEWDTGEDTDQHPYGVTGIGAGCQAVAADPYAEAGVSFEISYRDPSTGEMHHMVVTESVSAGRSPTDNGLLLSSGRPDQSISANAVKLTEEEGQVVVRNTSSYALIEVQRTTNPMKLESKEELRLVGDATVVVPGRIFRHEITIKLGPRVESDLSPTGTTTFLPSDYELPSERREVLAHLCAPVFYPDRFSSRQTASDIAKRIGRHGTAVTPKEVNNKIQRTKDGIEEKCLTELNNRDELAAFLVTHKLITRKDVHDLVLNQ